MSLTLPANTKGADAFMAFYKMNQADVERILWDACWRHKDIVDPNDMHQDLFVRLHRSKFLERFDPKQSQLGTFFTGRVNGYAQHVVTKTLRKSRRFDQALCMEFNNTEEDRDASPELSVNPDTEDNIFNEEVFKQTCDILDRGQKQILKMYLEGHSSAEVAAFFKISVPALLNRWSKIKDVILSKNDWAEDGEDGAEDRAERAQALLSHWNSVETPKRVVRKKVSIGNGNGHAKEKRRPLSEREKLILRNLFVEVNGQIESKVCIEMKKHVGHDICMAQVTGYMVGLHALVKKGLIALKDDKAYYGCLAAHRAKWATYQSPRYQDPKFQAQILK
jgi:RNA polymerase sigma factor (sigma-70 family)